MNAYHAIATRIENAHSNFAEILVSLGGVTEAQARKVSAYYLAKKLAKMDAVNGRITVKNGAYLDREVIQRAAELAA